MFSGAFGSNYRRPPEAIGSSSDGTRAAAIKHGKSWVDESAIIAGGVLLHSVAVSRGGHGFIEAHDLRLLWHRQTELFDVLLEKLWRAHVGQLLAPHFVLLLRSLERGLAALHLPPQPVDLLFLPHVPHPGPADQQAEQTCS